MSDYQTPAEAAKDIRERYKIRGWTARQISVRSDSFSGGSSIDITIKDPKIPIHEAKAIAEDKERIHRDHFGEILGGANRFVSVNVSSECAKAKATPYLETVKSAISCLPEHPTSTLQPVGHGYHVGRGPNGYGFSLWGDSYLYQGSNADEIAYYLAVCIEQGKK